VVDGPEVGWDLAYRHAGTKGKILRCYDIDREGTMALLYDKLKALHRKRSNTDPSETGP
jgi:hypothetical protein